MTVAGQLRILLLFLHEIGGKNRLRFIYALKDGLRCHYCRVNLDFKNQRSRRYATFDHIHPKSKGGTKDEENLVVACRICNAARGNVDYHVFRARMMEAA